MSDGRLIHGGASSRLSKPGRMEADRRNRHSGSSSSSTGSKSRRETEKAPDAGETQADCIRRFRQQHSLPVLNALKTWLDTIAPKVLPDTKLGDAVSYTLNQLDYLTRYTNDGRMPIDNNILEREIRVFATGRKSWLFSDTADGAKASAVIYSLMLTCRA